MTSTSTLSSNLILLNEESDYANSLNCEQLSCIAEEMACFYKTLLAVAQRNRARRSIDIPEPSQAQHEMVQGY